MSEKIKFDMREVDKQTVVKKVEEKIKEKEGGELQPLYKKFK